MKLGEALNRRADIARKMTELRARFAASVASQEGEEPPEDVDELLVELDALSGEMATLVARINLTNAQTPFEDSGGTVTEALAVRDALSAKLGVLQAAVSAAESATGMRYMRSELRSVRNLDVKAARAKIDEGARLRREADNKLQEVNWSVDLIEAPSP